MYDAATLDPTVIVRFDDGALSPLLRSRISASITESGCG
jgi:hypothetical protein